MTGSGTVPWVTQVLDVTWTDGPSQAAPPSEPPPPPPPDDDSDIDASDQPQSLPTEEEEAFTRVNSTRRLKKELWRRRSDFLGTSSQYIEEAENTVKPPPDLSHFLRQEREAERGLLESQVSKSSPLELLSEAEITRREREIIENLERSEQLQQQQYIWEDHRQDDGQTLEKNEIDEHMQYQEELSHCVPPPPPSPVSDITRPFAYLAANLPAPSDFIPMSPLPEGDEISNCINQHNGGGHESGVCSSPPPLPLAPPECSVPSLTPIPECEEVNPSSPLLSVTEIITTPEVTTPHPSSPQVIIPYIYDLHNNMGNLYSPCVTSPECVPSPMVEAASGPSFSTSPIYFTASSTTIQHSNVEPCSDKVPLTSTSDTGEMSSFNIHIPVENLTTDPLLTTNASQSTHNADVIIPELPKVTIPNLIPSTEAPSLSPQTNAEVSASVLQLHVLASLTESQSVMSTQDCLGPDRAPIVSVPSTEATLVSPVMTFKANTFDISPEYVSSDSNSYQTSENASNPESLGTSSSLNIRSSSSVMNNTCINSNFMFDKLACKDDGLEHTRDKEQTKCNTFNSVKKNCQEKQVRFNIEESSSDSDSVSEFISKPSDSDAGVLNPQNAMETSIIDAHKQEHFAQNCNSQSTHSCITTFALSPSQAKNLQTSSESDRNPVVPMMVPVTSTNIYESSESVSKTTDSKYILMNSDNIDSACAVLKSVINTENAHAEVVKSHVVKAETFMDTPSISPYGIEPQTSVETEHQLPSEPRQQYPDHLMAHIGTLDYSSDSVASTSSHPEEYKKLAELEEEMMRHDKDMLRRTGQLQAGPAAVSDSQPTHIPPPTPYASHEESAVPLHQISPSIENSSYNFQPQSSSHLPIQEFYTAPTYDSTPPASLVQAEGITGYRPQGHKTVTLPSGSPSQYSTLASPHPFSRSNSQSTIEAPKHTPVHAVRSTPLASPRESIPEPLPRKNKVPPPAPNKSQKINSDLNTTERHEAIRSSRMPTSESLMAETEQPESQGPSVSPSGQQMSKQTLLALSAIPKPRLTDNESWITKKKPDAQKRDYSKHWLHQEAEQRRLEQMDRISRQKVPVSQPQLKSPQNVSPQHTPQHSSPSQTTSYLPTQNTPSYPPQNTTPTYSSYPQALKNPSPSHNCNNNNNNNNASWRNQATTYQPHMPSPAPNGDKALPDSIIHNLTQRVNNKNNKNTYSNTSGRLGNNYGNNFRDENYHDYMNADALSASHTHAPLYQSGMGPGQPSPPSSQQDVNSAQDQRLLSVSGKKKCSHCSEELGMKFSSLASSTRDEVQQSIASVC
ncbi:hypothetical protein Hamer_G017015 [Homarus americanus]|uniref:Uncharacterized protein n=1 Tax=Homarus americanus TaxID=6706 RepID=A0A8J5NAW6_HOMAM|nr:hypothetical protein Hamer_G017015 [Homarus americanus]